jgi:transcriptional antiterminator NusG
MSTSKRYDTSKRWYAIHTYSGYEEKVAESIRQRADSLDMGDKIFQVLVPKEKMIEVKNGKRKVVEKRIFQGYVMVQMKMSEDAWYIVRNTPSVTGFVGSGSEPTPISQDEMEKIMKRMGREEPKHKIDFNIGEVVNIIDGPFKGFDGSINEVDTAKGKLKVLVNMFGRETPVELDSLQVKRV